MEGITEQQPPSRNCDIYENYFEYGEGYSNMRITLKKSAEGRFTMAQVCQRIRYFPGRLTSVTVWWEDSSEYPDSDLEALGHALHDLSCLHVLNIEGAWTDEKASLLVRRVSNPSIRELRIAVPYDQKHRILTILAELQRARFTSLRTLVLRKVELDDSDCESLGQMLQCQQRGGFTIAFAWCLFASIKGYLVLADAAIKNRHFLSFAVRNSVTDASIPGNTPDSTTIGEESHGIFYNICEKYKKEKESDREGSDDVDAKAWSFHDAAKEHMDGYNDLNRAGLWKLSSKFQTATVQEWVDAVCHDRVRDRVDHLFHFLKMNPDVYANAALGRSKAKAATANNNHKHKGNGEGNGDGDSRKEKEKKRLGRMKRKAQNRMEQKEQRHCGGRLLE